MVTSGVITELEKNSRDEIVADAGQMPVQAQLHRAARFVPADADVLGRDQPGPVLRVERLFELGLVERREAEAVGEIVEVVPVLGIVDADLLGIGLLDVVGDGGELGVGPLGPVLLGEDVRVHRARRPKRRASWP